MKAILRVMIVMMLVSGGVLMAAPGDVLVRDDVEYLELEIPAHVLTVLTDYGYDPDQIDALSVADTHTLIEMDRDDYEGALKIAVDNALSAAVVFHDLGPSYIKIGSHIWTKELVED